jgi:hypothetical protein
LFKELECLEGEQLEFLRVDSLNVYKFSGMNNLTKTKTLLLGFILAIFLTPVSASSFENTIIKLNPDFKLKRLSNGTVVMSSVRQGETVKHQFTDLYADILLAAYRKQRVGIIMDIIAKKYYYSDEDCRREIKRALNVLAEWNIVIREEKLANIR